MPTVMLVVVRPLVSSRGAGDAEVGEEDARVIGVEVGDHDVGGFDVAVQQAPCGRSPGR